MIIEKLTLGSRVDLINVKDSSVVRPARGSDSSMSLIIHPRVSTAASSWTGQTEESRRSGSLRENQARALKVTAV